MKKKQIRNIDKQIKSMSKLLKDTEKQLKWARTLPDDPSVGMDLDKWFPYAPPMKNENPHLKADYIDGFNYTIGYCTGNIEALKQSKYFLTVSKKQFRLDEIKDKKTDKKNRKTMKELKERITKKIEK